MFLFIVITVIKNKEMLHSSHVSNNKWIRFIQIQEQIHAGSVKVKWLAGTRKKRPLGDA